jgi:ankyrin repeat protein
MVAVGMGRHDDFSPKEEKNALEAAKILVELGADINQATETGWTAMHAAAFGGATSVVEFLASKGANLNAINGCGQSPYSLAAGTNARGLLERVTPHKSTADLLKKLGAVDKPQGKAVGKCVEGRYGLEYATVDKLEEAAKAKKANKGDQAEQ